MFKPSEQLLLITQVLQITIQATRSSFLVSSALQSRPPFKAAVAIPRVLSVMPAGGFYCRRLGAAPGPQDTLQAAQSDQSDRLQSTTQSGALQGNSSDASASWHCAPSAFACTTWVRIRLRVDAPQVAEQSCQALQSLQTQSMGPRWPLLSCRFALNHGYSANLAEAQATPELHASVSLVSPQAVPP